MCVPWQTHYPGFRQRRWMVDGEGAGPAPWAFHWGSHTGPTQKGLPLSLPTLETQGSATAVLKVLIIFSLNLCFMSKVQWDNGGWARSLEPGSPASSPFPAATRAGVVSCPRLPPPLCPCPATVTTLAPHGAGHELGRGRFWVPIRIHFCTFAQEVWS